MNLNPNQTVYDVLKSIERGMYERADLHLDWNSDSQDSAFVFLDPARASAQPKAVLLDALLQLNHNNKQAFVDKRILAICQSALELEPQEIRQRISCNVDRFAGEFQLERRFHIIEIKREFDYEQILESST